MNTSFWKAVFTITATVIGAGILALPYLFAKAGFVNSVVLLFIVGIIMMLVHLCLAEVTLRTKGIHQLTGYARIYLGNKGKWLMFVVNSVSIYGALIAYIIGASEALSNIFSLNRFILAVIFFVFVAFIVSRSINFFENSESLLELFKFAFLAAIFLLIFCSPFFSIDNLGSFNSKSFFLPVGGLIFALLGISTIPSIREGFKNKELKLMKPAIISAYFIIFLVYVIFTCAIVGITGVNTTDVATSGVGLVLGSFAAVLINLFAVFAMATPFIGLGFALKENFIHDLDWDPFSSWFLACVVPGILAFFILYLSTVYDIRNIFSGTINLTGLFADTIIILIIIIIFFKARRNK